MVEVKRSWPHLTGTLLVSSLTSIGLFFGGVLINQNYFYSFMVWNLFLAWVPLLFIVWLGRTLRKKRWSSWQGIALSLGWLGFLPNSFYMISDYIHLKDAPRVDVLYDAVMLTSFVITGLLLGFLSLYMFHVQLSRRVSARVAAAVVGFVLLLCSTAIYMGRDLRWNTWDLFINPAGIVFDVSDRLIYPREYPQTFITVLSFFVLLCLAYFIIWNIIRTLRTLPRR